jgi:hypothetical protein
MNSMTEGSAANETFRHTQPAPERKRIMQNVAQHPSTVEYLETLRQALQRDAERHAATCTFQLRPTPKPVAQVREQIASVTTRRNAGGRYTARSTWYDAIAQAHIARIEAMDAQAEVARLAQVVGDAVTALPDAAAQITKAATLVQSKQVWPLTSGNYLVGSQSDDGAAYLVTRGPWQCECKAATYQDGPCKHVLAAQITVKMGRTYQPTYN